MPGRQRIERGSNWAGLQKKGDSSRNNRYQQLSQEKNAADRVEGGSRGLVVISWAVEAPGLKQFQQKQVHEAFEMRASRSMVVRGHRTW